MKKVATVVLGSVGSSSWGRRSFHFGSSFILQLSSSYLSRPCLQRKLESSFSLLSGMSSSCVSSSMLCHVPSRMLVKNFSRLKAALTVIFGRLCYFSVDGRAVVLGVGLISRYLVLLFIEHFVQLPILKSWTFRASCIIRWELYYLFLPCGRKGSSLRDYTFCSGFTEG